MKPLGRFTRTSCTSPETGFVNGASWTSSAPGTRKELWRPAGVNSIAVKTGGWMSAIVLPKSSNAPLPFALPEKMRTSASRCSAEAALADVVADQRLAEAVGRVAAEVAGAAEVAVAALDVVDLQLPARDLLLGLLRLFRHLTLRSAEHARRAGDAEPHAREAPHEPAGGQDLLQIDERREGDHPADVHHADQQQHDHERGAAAGAVERVVRSQEERAGEAVAPVLVEEEMRDAAVAQAAVLERRQLVEPAEDEEGAAQARGGWQRRGEA